MTHKLKFGHLLPKVLEYHGEAESFIALNLRFLHSD